MDSRSPGAGAPCVSNAPAQKSAQEYLIEFENRMAGKDPFKGITKAVV